MTSISRYLQRQPGTFQQHKKYSAHTINQNVASLMHVSDFQGRLPLFFPDQCMGHKSLIAQMGADKQHKCPEFEGQGTGNE
jgi:hypothetical protein